MTKVAILGAGSAFTAGLTKDILLVDGLDEGEFALVDIDPRRLDPMHRAVQRVVDAVGKKWKVTATTDRRQALPGCSYIINSIEVSGLATVACDYRIPKRYGVDQCIGDTIGPGGIMKMLRTGPSWVAILRDAERLCPDAYVLNYTNPMSMMTLLARRVSSMKLVGLCHSVQGGTRTLARYANVPREELDWECAGINHVAWYTKLEHDGKSLYPLLLEKIKDRRFWEKDPVRFELMKHFGAFPTESSGHHSEYYPYFRKDRRHIRRYTRRGYLGEPGFYAKSWPRWRESYDRRMTRRAEGKEEIKLERGLEYAADIIEGIETGREKVCHCSVPNDGLIENLPRDGIVEVACRFRRGGFDPVPYGKLPPQLAALCSAHMGVYELGVRAVIEESREAVYHAMMLDPLTAAILAPERIRRMADELLEAERDFVWKATG